MILKKVAIEVQRGREALEMIGRELFEKDEEWAKRALAQSIEVHTNLGAITQDVKIAFKEGMKAAERFCEEDAEDEMTEADRKKMDRIKKELEKEKDQTPPVKRARVDKSSKICYGCGGFGHFRNEPSCPKFQGQSWGPNQFAEQGYWGDQGQNYFPTGQQASGPSQQSFQGRPY